MIVGNSSSRRALLSRMGALFAGLALGAPPIGAVRAQARAVGVGVGLHTQAGPLVLHMQRSEGFRQAARELGEAIDATFQDYQALLRMLQAIAAGQLQIGSLGGTPLIRLLATPQPAIPIALGGGHINYPLQVPPGSPIRNLADLEGKTIVTLVGSELQLALSTYLRAQFGHSDVRRLGITVRNAAVTTELYEPVRGADAQVGLDPGSESAEERGILRTVVRTDGRSGAQYRGTEGEGAGRILTSFREKSEFFPEAFLPSRIWWVVGQGFLDEQPKIVEAFLVALARTNAELARAPMPAVLELVKGNWPGSADAQSKALESALWRRRGWPWITESEVKAHIRLSGYGEMFERPLDAARTKGIFERGARVVAAAAQRMPALAPAAFERQPDGDQRGRPQWDAAAWQLSS